MSGPLPPTSNPPRPPLPLARAAAPRERARFALCLCAIFGCGPPSWPGGIHVLLGWSATRVRVVEVPAEGPAARAGLAPDDVIVAIDGTPVAGLSAPEVHARLRGEVGSSVRLTVLRDGAERELVVPRTPYDHGASRR